MKVVLAYTHHPRCGPHYWKRAFRQLGHDVVSVGPWDASTPYGTRDRRPDVELPMRDQRHYQWAELGVETPDLFMLCEGGEDIRVLDVPCKWAHLSTEGTNLDWSPTPHRYFNLGCNGANPETSKWLPNAFDQFEHWPRIEAPEYDLVQIASARDARRFVWDYVQREAPDLHTVFGDMWGPLYGAAYRNALATFTCSSLDFVTLRVMEGMASGCVVIADRTPSMAALFTEGVHFIGYDPVPGPGGEGMPDPAWLIETVRRLRKDGPGEMPQRALAEVRDKHGYQHRVATVLKDVFG